MTFEEGCKFSYDIFKKEYGTGIGTIDEYKNFWVFAKYSEAMEYGTLPIVVYKDEKRTEYLTFELSLRLAGELANPVSIPVPEIYTN